jgi:hypothetical protein
LSGHGGGNEASGVRYPCKRRAWPLVARAQPSGKIWRIGFIAHRYEEFYDPLFQGLRELGYTEGQNLVVERRYAEGRVERFKEFAAEMVQLKVEYRKEIIGFALRERLPSMFVAKLWVEEGGLMSYGDRVPERYRRAADLVDRILKGAKPADLPVEQPTTFELVVNLKTAKAIGLNLPPAFLARADQVIE